MISNVRMQNVRTPIFIRRGIRNARQDGTAGVLRALLSKTPTRLVPFSLVPFPEVPKDYPEAGMFGRLPSYGLYCRHVTGLRLRGIEFGAVPSEPRPAIVCDDVKTLNIDGLRTASVESGQPVLKLIQTSDAFLRAIPTSASVTNSTSHSFR